MVRNPQYDPDESEEELEEEDEEEQPAPKKKVLKKPVSAPVQKAPQPQIVQIPIFESQAQQIFYDQLILLNQKLDKVNADLELMKKYLPQQE